jgi:hypothetical protein
MKFPLIYLNDLIIKILRILYIEIEVTIQN